MSGCTIPVVAREPRAGAAEAGHHLVGDEQHAVATADVRDCGPVVVGWNRRAGGRAADRLGDERGDPLRARGARSSRRAARRAPRPVSSTRYGYIAGTRSVSPSHGRYGARSGIAAGEVERAAGVAVIRAVTGEHDVAVGLAAGQVVGPGELARGLDRLAPATHRVHPGVDRRAPAAPARRRTTRARRW